MTPAFQQVVDPQTGDCMRACIASILDLPIDDVPNFKLSSSSDMSWSINQWLAPRGLAFLSLSWMSPECVLWHVDGYAILSMPSQCFPGQTHAVVARLRVVDQKQWRWDIVHDPNPTNQPYDRQTEPRRVYVLVHRGVTVDQPH